MGRRPTKQGAIPHLRARSMRSGVVWYYYDHGIVDGKRVGEPLGRDYGLAVQRWAEIEREGAERAKAIITFRYVAERYRAEVVPTKARGTQRQNLIELTRLLSFFDDPPGPLDAILPIHVRQYMRWRRAAPASANRERALLSHIWNWARGEGYTAQPNPCAGIHGYREAGRDVYVEDDAYRATWHAADVSTRDAMDLIYLTGQRPGDVLRMDRRDIHDGALHVRQSKTGKALRITIEGELAAVLARIAARKAALPVTATRLLVNEAGQPLTAAALRYRFKAATAAAGATFQLRDLRAKAATDKADAGTVTDAQRQLGHASVTMTEHYVRQRRGDRVTPTK